MKAFERIFLYSVLAVLFFYVFLVDGNVESKVAIQEEIRARRIVIVNDAGQEVVKLTNDENSGWIGVYNNSGILVTKMGAKHGGTLSIANKDGKFVAGMGDFKYGGMMVIFNKDGTPVALVRVNENDNGIIEVANKHGEVIGSLP